MAIAFDEVDDYYTIADAAGLTLQDGDWCVGIWTKLDDLTGEDYQKLLSNNQLDTNGSMNLYPFETNHAFLSGKWRMNVTDGDGTVCNPTSSSAPGADSKWRLVIMQRDATPQEIQLWLCEANGVASKEGSEPDTDLGAIDGGDWYVARASDGRADLYYGGIAAELFKGDFALTQAQIETLAAGLPIKSLAKQASLTLDVYLPMWEADATLLDYSNNGNDATRSSAPTTTTHPPICTPTKRRRM